MPEKQNTGRSVLNIIGNNFIAVMLILIIFLMFIPIGKTAVDIAMAINLALSFIILLTVLNLKRPADFTTFPRLVLMMTIFGTAINISSTRLILMNPVTGTGHLAGQSELVQAFANIVAGKNIVIGFFIFIILTVFQVIVITKGADRVSEVSARFTLDSMNNKMFNIQNQVNSGALTEEEGNLKIKRLGQEISFFSTMDGATKFVSGNVKFGIFVTFANLIGGVIMGQLRGASGIGEAFKTYSVLTIGDGLMSQFPALMISFATGLLITGSEEENLLTDRVRSELSASGIVYVIVGIAFIILGIAFHNGSSFILIPIGGLLVFVGYYLSKANRAKEEAAKIQAQEAQNAPKKESGSEEASPVAKLDDLSLEIGYALIPLVDNEKGAELMSRIKRIRHECALDLGLVIPSIHIMDQMSLQPEEYSFKLRGIEIGKGRLKMNHFMCLNTGGVPKDREMVGEKTKDPAFGMDAIWLPESKSLEAEKAGYAIIDAPTIIATHLTEVIRSHIAELLTRQDVQNLVNNLKDSNPVLVDELIPKLLGLGEIQKVLQNLLEEGISIRDLLTIFETLADHAQTTRDTDVLTEYTRQALKRAISSKYFPANETTSVVTLDPKVEQEIMSSVKQTEQGAYLTLDPEKTKAIMSSVETEIQKLESLGKSAIIITSPIVRMYFKKLSEDYFKDLIVVSYNEVETNVELQSVGMVSA